MIEAGAPNTGELQASMARVCVPAPPGIDMFALPHYRRSRLTLQGRNVKAALERLVREARPRRV
jgi:hypothetical protein